MTLRNVRPYSALTGIRMSDRNRETPYFEIVNNNNPGLGNPIISGRDSRDVTAAIKASGVKDRNVEGLITLKIRKYDKTQSHGFAILQS